MTNHLKIHQKVSPIFKTSLGENMIIGKGKFYHSLSDVPRY